MDTNPIPQPAPTPPEPEPDIGIFPPPSQPSAQVFTPGQIQPQVTQPTVTPTVTPASMPAFMQETPQIDPQNPLASPIFNPPAKKRRFSKRLLLLTLLPILLIGGSAAAYLGYYLPNKPSNIWSTALTNTGKGYDKLSDYAVGLSGSKFKGVKLNGTFKTTGLLAADGSFQGSNNGANGEFTASLSAVGIKINVDTRLIQSSAGTPDVYFKVDGLQDLGTLLGGSNSTYATALNGLNDKWYFVDHSLFDQFTGSSSGGLQITSSDVSSVLKAVGDASKQNVFTSNPAKMAFTDAQNVGKETQDGRSVYHFKAAINKQNLKNYVTALCTNLSNSSLKKFLGGDSQSVKDSLGCSTATSSVSNFSSSRTADVWVDTRTKLIHKIRFVDPNHSGNFFEIGQDYQGGDNFPFTLDYQSKSSDDTSTGSVTITLNMKTNQVTINGSSSDKGSDGSNIFGSSISLTISPNNNPVTVEKPANAETLIQLLNDAGLGNVYGDVQTDAKDTKRKTDINALQGQIEAYDTNSGFYPTLANINDANWRATNMKGLDPSALQDPDGTTGALVASPVANSYSYEATPAGCDDVNTDCSGYTLTATLSDGTTYPKTGTNLDTTSPPVLEN